MDSKKLLGVPVSATGSAPPVLPSSTSTGIRAPLTLDDSDFEYGQKDSGFSSYGSDSGVDSDGFLSGEERFETASKRVFVAEANDEIHEETRFLKQYVVSRPLVKCPPKEINDESSSDREFDDSRPVLLCTDEEIVENDVAGEFNGFRPFVADKCVEDVGTSTEEHEIAPGNDLPLVDIQIPLLPQQQGIPIAKLSGYSDDDSLGSESVEEETFLGVARVPSSGFLERFVGAPKVRILEVGEGDEYASVSDYGSEAEVNEDSIFVGGDNGEKKQISYHLISADVIEDNGPEIAEEVGDAELHEHVQDFHGDIGEKNFELGISANDPDLTRVVNSNTLEISAVELTRAKAIEGEAKDSLGAASMDDGKCANTDGNEGEKSVCKIEHKIDEKSKSHCFDDPDNVESIDYATSEKEVQMMNYVKLSDGQATQDPEFYMNGHLDVCQKLVIKDSLCSGSPIPQATSKCTKFRPEGACGEQDDAVFVEDDEYLVGRDVNERLDFEVSNGVDTIDQLEQSTAPSLLSHEESSCSHLQTQAVRDLGDETDVHRQSEGEDMGDCLSLAALLRAATAESSSIMLTSVDGKNLLPLEQTVGSDSRFLGLRPTAQLSPTPFTPRQMDNGESVKNLSQEEKRNIERLQEMRLKFLRLVHGLNMSPKDSVAVKVLYQLELATGRSSVLPFNFDFSKQDAIRLEAEGKKDLNFSLNILVIGKSGVGKSATINSIFGEEKATTNAFEPATTSVKEITGTLNGIQVRVFDTPGFRFLGDQSFNRRILSSIKRFTKKLPPDVVLYVDRIDTQTRDLGDLPLLKLVTSYLGSSIWYKAIVILTHASSVPPEGPSGYPLSYDIYVSGRSRFVQQLISHSVGNLHTVKPSLIPVALIENRSTCEMNKNEQTFLTNGDRWRSQLLLLCCSMKILWEIDSVLKNDEVADYQKLFGFRVPSPSLLYFLSSLLQSNSRPKLSSIEGDENFDSNIELAFSSDCDQQRENEYEQLPPFRPLTKSEIAKLNKEQRDAYFGEYDYRVKLFQKKQWNRKVRRFQHAKKKQKDMDEDQHPDMDPQEAVAVPLPDMVLPLSFDGDYPAYWYRLLESSSRCITRPVLDLHGWDHDCGYDGFSIEDNLGIAGRFPAVFQLTKDKEEFNTHLNSCVAAKHGDKGSTMAGLGIETVEKQLAYTLKAETKLGNFRVNRTAAVVSITCIGENVIAGLKVEDEIALGKDLVLVGSTGLVKCETDAAYGANFGIHLREKNYPVGRDQSRLGLSLTKWRGDLLWGLNLQSQLPVGRNSNMSVRARFNSNKRWQVSTRISSSDQLPISTLGLLPIAKTIWKHVFTPVGQR